MNRLQICASLINERFPSARVLDVGCRGKELERLLKSPSAYLGIDLAPGERVLVHDVEQPLPFSDSEFDVVCALDVIEHVEHAAQLVSELIRVTSRAAILSLPNMYHWRYRLRYALGHELGAKYAFPPYPLKDRHRWLPSYASGLNFVQSLTSGQLLTVTPVIAQRSRFKLMESLDRCGAQVWPNLFAHGAIYLIEKRAGARNEMSSAAAQ